MKDLSILLHNRQAWDREVAASNAATIPYSADQIERAKKGDWTLLLTPLKSVPDTWIDKATVKGKKILCLGGGGGQQALLLAAAGADVTLIDNSPSQLHQDKIAAEAYQVRYRCSLGDMRNLSEFGENSFDLVVNPISNQFIPETKAMWVESYRVLRRSGTMIAAFMNPFVYLFDPDKAKNGIYELKYGIPYSDLSSIDEKRRFELYGSDPIEFGHSLDFQISGQIDAGFLLSGFYSDYSLQDPIRAFMPSYFVTRSTK